MTSKTKLLGFLLLIFSSVITAQEIKHPPGNYATINGHKFWYEIEGQGKPVFLIPGRPGIPTHIFIPGFQNWQRILK